MRRMIFLAAVLAAMLTASTAVRGATGVPTLTVSPNPFPAGLVAPITLSGAGYRSNETLVFGILGLGTLGKEQAAPGGTFTFTTNISLAPGSYTAYVMAEHAQRFAIVAQMNFLAQTPP